MSTRATLRAVSYLGTFGSKLLELADDFETDVKVISDWITDDYPYDPESIRVVGEALTGAGVAVLQLESLTSLVADTIRAAVADDTPPLIEVAEA